MADNSMGFETLEVGQIPQDGSLLPTNVSTIAADIDFGFMLATWVSLFFFVAIVGAMVVLVMQYRRKGVAGSVPVTGHNTPLEITWTVLPLVLVMGLFLVGFQGFVTASVAPANAMEVNITGQKWSWTVTYPGTPIVLSNELVVPKGRPVKLIMSAKDVLHSFYIPNFRVKQDAVPGSYSSLWFEATATGEYPVECTEYCGTAHSNMLGKVIVKEPEEYDQWLRGAADPTAGMTPEKAGETLYKKFACNTCHSVDGTKLTGPTFAGLFGKTESTTTGDVLVDENYVRESILNPMAKVVTGYTPAMPTFKGLVTDKDLDNLIAFIKTKK